MWKSKRNVRITYKPLPASPLGSGFQPTKDGQTGIETAPTAPRMDDEVSYQKVGSDEVKTISGVDRAPGPNADVWDWRGKGWLMIASSHWEVLGHGGRATEPVQDLAEDEVHDSIADEWVVTYFAKTLFTPAGIDIYSRKRDGLSSATVTEIRKSLAELGDPQIQKLAEKLFEVQHDNTRPD